MDTLWGEKVGVLAKRKALESLSAYDARQAEMAQRWEADRKVIAFKMIRELWKSPSAKNWLQLNFVTKGGNMKAFQKLMGGAVLALMLTTVACSDTGSPVGTPGDVGDNVGGDTSKEDLQKEIDDLKQQIEDLKNDDVADTTSPTVTFLENFTTKAPVDLVLIVLFSEDVKGVSNSTVYLRQVGYTVNTPATVTYDSVSKSYVLKPQSVLELSTAYTVTVDASITDLAGNPLTGNATTSFQTVD